MAIQPKIEVDFSTFLEGESIRCPIPGCDWAGTNLSMHAVKKHGISAEEFKEIIGANRHQPLCTQQFSEERRRLAIQNNFLSTAPPDAFQKLRLANTSAPKRRQARLQTKQSFLPVLEKTCVKCGSKFKVSRRMQDQRKYCSNACRRSAPRR